MAAFRSSKISSGGFLEPEQNPFPFTVLPLDLAWKRSVFSTDLTVGLT
jgi:hypothetical protein